MIDGNIAATGMEALPQMVGTNLLTQKQLDECSRALGRPLWNFEVKILDEVLCAQDRVNRKLARRGMVTRCHSMDEVVHLFVERVRHLESERIAEKMLKEARF